MGKMKIINYELEVENAQIRRSYIRVFFNF